MHQNKTHFFSKYFLLLCALTLLPSILVDLLIFENVDYINYFSGQIPSESIEPFVKQIRNWSWLTYLITGIIILIKIFLVSGILWIGSFLSHKKQDFRRTLEVALFGQFVFSIKGYILLFDALLNKGFSFESIQNFHPLSLASLFDTENIPGYWSFLLQSLNLFEVAYWFLLAYFISKELKGTFNDGLKVVVSSYIPAFVLWLVTVTFFLVSNS